LVNNSNPANNGTTVVKTNAEVAKKDENTGQKIVVPGQIVTAIKDPNKDAKKADIELNLYDKVLYFKTDSAAARKTDGAKVASTGGALLEQKNYIGAIYITGVTSVTGTKKHNADLGMRRAKSVANYFAVSGLDRSIMQTSNQLTIKSSCAPVRECDKDRRVDVKVKLSDKLNKADMDPVLRAQIRDNLVAKLKAIWENNVEIQE